MDNLCINSLKGKPYGINFVHNLCINTRKAYPYDIKCFRKEPSADNAFLILERECASQKDSRMYNSGI